MTAEGLPTTHRILNRRALLRGGSIATALAVLLIGGANASPALKASPTKLGRAFLAAVTEYRTAFQDGNLPDDEAGAASDRLSYAIAPLITRIKAQPITSLSHLVDCAIVAAYHDDNNDNDHVTGLIGAVCGLAGINPTDAMA